MAELDIQAQLAEAKKRKWDDRTLAQRAADMAQELLLTSLKAMRSDERTLVSALARLATDKKNLRFVQELCGSVFHATDPNEQVENLRRILAEHGGVPAIFSTVGKLRFKAAAMAARSMQGAAIAEVQRIFRSTFGELTLPTLADKVAKRVKEAAKDGLTLALNPLVPQVYGPKSAEKYFKHLEAILSKQDGVGVVIQPWRLCPNLTPYSPEAGAKALAEKLRPLLKLSVKSSTPRPILVESGLSTTMNIVAEAFRLAMAGSALHKADAALEIPAYLKGSPALLREMTEWATARSAKGAAPLKVLLVKGSHLDAEQENTYNYGTANEVCRNKGETESRFKQLISTAMGTKEKVLTPIVGTHNLFDIAYGLLSWGRAGRSGSPQFCFISGLANHIARVLTKGGARVLLTTGVTSEGGEAGFESYLLNLVQELGRPEGILASGGELEANSMGWGRMRQHFLAALSGREEQPRELPGADGSYAFTRLNHITDRAHMDALHNAAAAEAERPQEQIPLHIDGEETESPLLCIRRSLTAPGMEDYRYYSADFDMVNRVLNTAAAVAVQMPPTQEECRIHLLQAARLLEKRSTEFISLLVRDAGFTIEEADQEVANAIDSLRFYESSAVQEGLLDGTLPSPLGVVTVAPSRIHPLEEAAGGIAAAWVTGNTIIYKPSAHTIMLADRLTRLLNEAGFDFPRLQMLPCLDNQIARKLLTSDRVNGLIYHGSVKHTNDMVAASAGKPLLGGTGGSSSIYISSQGDWASAIHDICKSLFARAGQDPTAPHLIFVHAEVYDNQHFMNALRDAVTGITAQPGWIQGGNIGPLGRPISDDQRQLLTKLQKGESWLVAPATTEIGSLVWNPGVRLGVHPGSAFAQAAHNVPVLGIIRVESTEEAGRTQRKLSQERAVGIYSRDKQEIELWTRLTAASLVSINCCPQHRPGALPRPAWQNATPMSGGHNFITALSQWQETARPQHRGTQRNLAFAPWETLSPKPGPDDTTRLSSAADSIGYWWENVFGTSTVLNESPAQITTLNYRPLPLCIRAEKATSDIDLSIALMAALKAGCDIQLSTASMRAWMPRALEPLGVIISVETRDEFEGRFPSLATTGVMVRDTAATINTMQRAAQCRLALCAEPVLANGRLELLHCLREVVTTRRIESRK
ncbi:MAG: proline dehydrogenase family protein [Akkermansia sp.]|nr:proline dehydrogenase family protein [Akkermansia sp.]